MKWCESASCVVLSLLSGLTHSVHVTRHCWTGQLQSQWQSVCQSESWQEEKDLPCVGVRTEKYSWQVSGKLHSVQSLHYTFWLTFLVNVFVCSDQVLLLAAGLSVGLLLLLLLGLTVYYLWRKKGQSQYEELLPTVPAVPACSAPVILVSQGSWATLVSRKNIHTKHAHSPT